MPLDIDRYAHLDSTIQRWDPRAKILSLGIFAFGTALLTTIPFSGVALVMAMGLIRLTGMPLGFVLGGLRWVNLFLVPFFLILPFSYPGEPAFRILGLPFAWEGLRLATLIVIKANAIVLTSYAIFGSSRFDVSMIALQRLRMPRILVQMMLFTYRYIFVFLEELKRMDIAMRSRGFVMKGNLETLRMMGNLVGTLLVRSFERTVRVYKAMLSKGYQGEFHTLMEFRLRSKDLVKGALVIGVSLGLLAGDWLGLFAPALEAWW